MSRCAKGWLIAAFSLVLIGGILFVGVMSMVGWDFRKLSTGKYETNTHTLSDTFTDISIHTKTADVIFSPSADDTVSVVCYEEKNLTHTVSVEDDTLTITVEDTRKWYQHIGFHPGGPTITVYLPAGTYGELKIKAATGDITIPKDFSFSAVDMDVTTGDIIFSADVAGAMTVDVTTGDVKLSSVSCGDLTVDTTTGEVNLSNVTCRNLTSSGTTGDVVLNNVIATEAFSIKSETGNVTFKACDAADITAKTTTGDITGTLLTAKTFDAHATTGRVSVPQSATGGQCKLSATTGNISITIE